jgi:hypothetical protein
VGKWCRANATHIAYTCSCRGAVWYYAALKGAGERCDQQHCAREHGCGGEEASGGMGLVFPRLADQLGNRQIALNRYFLIHISSKRNSEKFEGGEGSAVMHKPEVGCRASWSRERGLERGKIWVYLVSLVHYT